MIRAPVVVVKNTNSAAEKINNYNKFFQTGVILMKKNILILGLLAFLIFISVPTLADTSKAKNLDEHLKSVVKSSFDKKNAPQVKVPKDGDLINEKKRRAELAHKLDQYLEGVVNSIKLNVNCPSIKFPHKVSEYKDFGAEVADLATKVPNIDNYENSYLWRKETDVVVNKDKSLDITRKIIAYIGETVPMRYRIYCIPVSKGATLELLDARIYDPKSGAPIALITASPVNLEGGGFALMLSVAEEALGRVIVMTYKEHRPADEYISFYTEFSDKDLPVWEQGVTVKAPKDIELYFDGINSNNLTKVEEENDITYLWHTTNQVPIAESPFIEENLPYIAFSDKQGGLVAIRSLSKIFSTAYQEVKIPEEFEKMDFNKMLAIIDSADNTVPSICQTEMRDASLVPAKGPWTLWEKVAIVSSYAQQLGATVEYSYIAHQGISDKSSATRELLNMPVLKIKDKKGKISYFVPNSSGCYDKISPLIAGRTVYFEKKNKVKSKILKSLSAEANHLDFYWKLKLDENGTALGTLQIDYAGIWQNLLADNMRPTKENIEEFIEQAFTLPINGLQLTCTGVSQKGSDKIRLDFDVKCKQAIVQGDRMLFRIPGGMPNILLELRPKNKNFVFKFPFIIDQKADVSVPAGYRLMQDPLLTNTPADSNVFVVKQVFDYKPQWHRVELDSKLVVKLKDVTAEQMQYVGQQIAAVCRWGMTDVGFAKKSVVLDQKKTESKAKKKSSKVKNEKKSTTTQKGATTQEVKN